MPALVHSALRESGRWHGKRPRSLEISTRKCPCHLMSLLDSLHHRLHGLYQPLGGAMASSPGEGRRELGQKSTCLKVGVWPSG